MNLYEIKTPDFLKNLNYKELENLAAEIRSFLIEKVSVNGGHLSSNLGVVELTIALHYVFNAPEDKIFFDVGHQCYTHKILTGRAKGFDNLRKAGSISGFQKRSESVYDCWEAGHSSTSLSAGLGMALARDALNQNYHVVPVIGDAAIAGGMSFEAMNQIGSAKTPMIIVLNDNDMSISKNNGALEKTLTKIRTSNSYIHFKSNMTESLSKKIVGPKMLDAMRKVRDTLKDELTADSVFKEFGLDYLGPVDGHNIRDLISALESAKVKKHPVLIHVITKKGKGYRPCELDEEGKWHGVGRFDVKTGAIVSAEKEGEKSFSKIVADKVYEIAKKDDKVYAITPAMLQGSKLIKFKQGMPDRVIDCGIAEEHGATLAAGMAIAGLKPYLFVYSTFMQRCYDQINHDIVRMDLPITLCIDRASLTGADGETHNGVFDISILSSLPNLVITQPSDFKETYDLLETANCYNHPFVMRFNKSNIKVEEGYIGQKLEIGKWKKLTVNDNKPDAIVITYGTDVKDVYNYCQKENLNVWVINALFIKPVDSEMLKEIAHQNCPVLVYTMDVVEGGLSTLILDFYNENNYQVNIKSFGVRSGFVSHGTVNQQRSWEKCDLETLKTYLHK